MRAATSHRERQQHNPLAGLGSRHLLEAAIEAHLAEVQRMIAILDLLDGDADFEPALGSQIVDAAANWAEFRLTDQSNWAAGGAEDLESDPCDGPIDDSEMDSSMEFSTDHAA